MTQRWNPTWTGLLSEAVTHPGRILAAYHAFHNYSLGNQLAALWQCHSRHLPLGPLASFLTWKERGRSVKKGEKALWLCMPVSAKVKPSEETQAEETCNTRTIFVWRPHWFVLEQTEGSEYEPPPIPGWDRASALQKLGITELPFEELDGNSQGYSTGRSIAINPLAGLPAKTAFHEMAHILLGHTTEVPVSSNHGEIQREREAEAEAVALLCCATLDLPGTDACRGYIQHWWGIHPLTEPMARRICTAADTILKAGTPEAVCTAK